MTRVLFVMVAAAALALAIAFFAYGLRGASANTFTVTSAADPGNGVCDADCTLREALDAANASAGHDVIDFDAGGFPPDAPVTISPSSALPASADSAGITIDGSGAGVIIDGGLLAGSEHGLVIQSSNATTSLTDVTVRSITVQNFPGSGVFVCGGVGGGCDQAVSDVLVEDVVTTGNSRIGVHVQASSVTDVEVRETTATGNTLQGIAVTGGTNTGTMVTDVTSSNNGGDGVSVSSFVGDIVDAQVSNVVANSNGGLGINVCCFNVVRPVLSGVASNENHFDNIFLGGDAIVDADIENCEANGSEAGSGIFVSAGMANSTIADCDANDNAAHGVRVVASGDRTIDGLAISGIATGGNGMHGMTLDVADSTLADLLIDDAASAGNGARGIFVRGGASVTNVEVRESTVTGNSGDGIIVGGGTNTGTVVRDVTSSNNGGFGIDIDAAGDTIDGEVSNVVTNSNEGPGINFCCNAVVRPRIANATSNGNEFQNILFAAESVVDGSIEGCAANGSQLAAGIYVSASTDDLTITDCEASDNAEEGIRIFAFGDRTIDGVAISDVSARDNGTHGVEITGDDQITDVSVESSTFVGNVSSGLETRAPIGAHFNRIFGNGVGLNNLSGLPLDAEDNWWGCNDGPDSGGCDSTLGVVDGDPWLLLDLTSDPDPAFAMSSADLTASLVRNSVGADTTGEGHVQDGTVIDFTTNAGGFPGANGDAQTASGKATATLTTGSEGVAQLTATLDDETVMLSLTILGPAPTPSPTPGAELAQGDNDCDGDVDAVDALQGLRFLAGLGVSQANGCPAIGSEVASLFGDVDCDGDVDAVDALQILRSIAGLPVSQAQGCPAIGEALG